MPADHGATESRQEDMNLSRKVTISALLWASASLVASAAVKDLPVRTINGKIYHYYEVPAKETVYSLCYKLGITKDRLIKDNPAVADGLKAGMILFFPMETSTEPSHDNNKVATSIINHKVQKGETIFGIAKQYGISTEELMAQNPVLQEGLKAGQVITVKTVAQNSSPMAPESATPVMEKQMNAYIVKKKETFYSIAHEHGVSVAELEAANPGVTSLKAGQVLNIPGEVRLSDDEKPAETSVAVETPSTDPSGSLSVGSTSLPSDSVPADTTLAAPVDKRALSIAVMLPFMLKEENPSKSAQRCTEFYKGLLLAADSLRHSSTPIHLTAFDTEGSSLTVRETLSQADFKDFDYIIAPDNAEQLAIIGEWSKNNSTKVLNAFVVKNDSYVTNREMMQGNLPSPLMLEKAVEGMSERLRYSTPVFVSINNTASDKADFASMLKKSLDAKGISYMELAVDGKLMPANLKALPSDGNYTFIPLSGKQADLNKIMPGIIEWRDEAITPGVKLFGYPEWITFRGETLENMHKLNTTVYSRFYADEESSRTRELEDRFRRWYGKGMDAAVPRQGLLGFDTGMFLIESFADGVDKYDGVQNGYHFVTSSPDGGSYNDVLYFINFRPGGVTEKINL